MATREPNLEPRRDTMCFLRRYSIRPVQCHSEGIDGTEYGWQPAHADVVQHSSRSIELSSFHTGPQQLYFIRNLQFKLRRVLSDLLSIRGILGRSVRPVQTRAR